MKKHLIAAGLAAAFAVPAMAQNVSISGVIDTAVAISDSDTADSTNKLVSSKIASENIKISGSEDLGGGMKAFFRFEQTVTPMDGTQNAGFNRGSEVGLSGSFGSVKVGKFDLTGAEGVDGVGQFGNISLFSNDIGSDVSHSVQYELPKMGGFTVQLGHSMGDGNGSGDINSVSATGNVGPAELRLGYTAQDLAAGENSQTAVGVKFAAGPVTVGIAYSDVDNATAADTKQTILSASMPIGSGLTAMAMVGNYSTTGSADADEFGIGVMKALSKRTSIYAAYNSNTTAADVETKDMLIGVIHKF
jgi:predicted porin